MRPEVIVFVMRGCGACESLKPLAQKTASHYGTCVDTRFVDVDEEEALADLMGVEATPTVVGVDPGRRPVVRMVGFNGEDGSRLVRVYSEVMGSTCQIKPFGDV